MTNSPIEHPMKIDIRSLIAVALPLLPLQYRGLAAAAVDQLTAAVEDNERVKNTIAQVIEAHNQLSESHNKLLKRVSELSSTASASTAIAN